MDNKEKEYGYHKVTFGKPGSKVLPPSCARALVHTSRIILYKPLPFTQLVSEILGEEIFWGELLSHETLHLVIFKLTNSRKESKKLDNLVYHEESVAYTIPRLSDQFDRARKEAIIRTEATESARRLKWELAKQNQRKRKNVSLEI